MPGEDVRALDASPLAVYRGPFTEREATRLLWRAGFGPRPGEAQALARRGLDHAVASLTRPDGAERLIGRKPHNAQGEPLDPINVWGDWHCWWLDRMVRTDQPLVERMTLVWHSWFATSIDGTTAALMLKQNAMMRHHWLGSFHDLLLDVTKDPAMLLWLSGASNEVGVPNENYAREMMELFTLGSGNGYSQHDVEEQARALTGWTNDWNDNGVPVDFRFDPALHDNGVKTIFGQRGRFDWVDSCRLCVEHPQHPGFMVRKLWDYFIADPIPARDASTLADFYRAGNYQVRPVMEAILRHPLFHAGARLLTPPAVFNAGLLRATRQTITTTDWSWIGEQMGQMLFEPPNVAGWNYAVWFDTARWSGRFECVNYAVGPHQLDPNAKRYARPAETAEQAVATALRFWGDPAISPDTRRNLLALSHRIQRAINEPWLEVTYRILRQNALRALIPTTPDWQTS